MKVLVEKEAVAMLLKMNGVPEVDVISRINILINVWISTYGNTNDEGIKNYRNGFKESY